MSEPRETDERLRKWLNGDQPARERLCTALLAFDREYSDIRPRRPEGGPDGGRDIEAQCQGRAVWGAVGFLNSVSDSAADKRQAKKKFESDLNLALKQKPDLKQFAFFTNVDLTPGEMKRLTEDAAKKGVSFVDIYSRERMRGLLDSTEGLAIRFQYLRIPLAEAEQVAFFSRFGESINETLAAQTAKILTKLDRLEFLHWRIASVNNIHLTLTLDRWYTPAELGEVTVMASLAPNKRPEVIAIGGCDDYCEMEGASMKPAWRFKSFHRDRKLVKFSTVIGNPFWHELPDVSFGVAFSVRHTMLVEEIDGALVTLWVNKPLIEKLRHVQITIGEYAVFESIAPKQSFWRETSAPMDWPGRKPTTAWMSHLFVPPISFSRTPRKASEVLMSVRPSLL